MKKCVSGKTVAGHCIGRAKIIKSTLTFVVISFALFTPSSQGSTVTLYDGTGLPAAQPWLFYAFNDLGATQSDAAPGVQLQTTAAVSAGYSNYNPLTTMFKNMAFPILDRSTGFELSFSARLNSESHSSNDRAGFSVILLGSDSKGIELGFWENEIWAQTGMPLHEHGAGVAIDTMQTRDYRVRILGDDYTLLDGSSTVLSGSVQDYTAFGGVPYTLPSYLFLGDNTASGGADVVLGAVSLRSNLTAVPEPTGVLPCVISMAILGFRRGRRAKAAIPGSA